MTESTAPQDSLQREKALDPQTSFICEAPAGSGKTELLTQRVLVLLARVEKPEEVLAITFTRKAAAEMRERIIKALIRAALPEPESQHEVMTWRLANEVLQRDKKLHWQLQQNPNRLQILTFDSLCARLTKSLPLHSALGASLVVTENSDELYRKAAQQIFLTLEQSVPWAPALGRLFRHVDNNYRVLEQLFVNLLGKRDQWLPIFSGESDIAATRSILESHLAHVIEESVSKLTRLIPELHRRPLAELAAFAGANLARAGHSNTLSLWQDAHELGYVLPGSDAEGIQRWRGLFSLLLTKTGGWRSRFDKNCGFPPGEGKEEKAQFKDVKQRALVLLSELKEVPDLLEALQELEAYPDAQYSDNQWEILEALAQVLPILVAHLHLTFRAEAVVDFSEISLRARQALGDENEPTELALRLDHRIQHILVDEFQDTSSNQLELLKQLTEGWQPSDGRTLFCVGDAMQSIYGFRGANVGLFLYCKQFGLGSVPLTPLKLTANFRSQSGIVDWFNRVFSTAFPLESDMSRGAVTFAPSEPFLPCLEEPAVQSIGIDEESHNGEGEKIADIIEQSITDFPERRIAILVRSKKHANRIMPSLQKRALKYRAVDLESLANLTSIQDLAALTLALSQPANRIAWLALLRSPLCGLSLEDLLTLVESETLAFDGRIILENIRAALGLGSENHKQNGQESLVQQSDMFGSVTGELSEINDPESVSSRQQTKKCLSEKGAGRLLAVYRVLEVSLSQRERKSLRQWVEGCWVQLGGPVCLTQKNELENVERYFSLLENLESQGTLINRANLDEALKRLYAAPDSNASDQIQIMTMHKSKGLEFDVVILPGLGQGTGASDQPLLDWHERLNAAGHEELIISPMKPKGAAVDPIYNYLRQEQKKIESLEACRLLYVACTRAKKKLYLTFTVKPISSDKESSKNGDDNVEANFKIKPPVKGALISHVWPSIKTELHYEQPGEAVVDISAVDNSAVEVAEGTVGSSADAIRRLPHNWQCPKLHEGHMLDEFIPHHEYANMSAGLTDFDAQQNSARHAGTFLHQLLNDMSVSGIEEWRKKAMDERLPFWRAQLINLGVALSVVDDFLLTIKATVETMLVDKNELWMVSPDKQRESEFSLTYRDGGEVVNITVDLVLTDANNDLWLIDFKTSQPKAEQALADFLVQERSAYMKKMRQYQRALEQLYGKTVKMALYFPVIGEWAGY